MPKGTLILQLLLSLLLTTSAVAQPGKQLWELSGVNGPISLGPNGNIYAADGHNLTCISPRGERLWTVESAVYYFKSAPVIGIDGTIYSTSVDGLVPITPDGEARKCAFQLSDGSGVGSLAVDSENTVYLEVYKPGGENYLLALDARLTPKWRYYLPGNVSFMSVAPAIGKDGSIYFLAYPGVLFAIDINGSLMWTSKVPPNDTFAIAGHEQPVIGPEGLIHTSSFAFDQNGSNVWSAPHAAYAHYITSPSGTSYAYDGEGITAINRDGSSAWRFQPTNNSVMSMFPALASDGTIIAASGGGIYGLQPNGQVAWFAKIPVGTGSSLPAFSPLIGPDGVIYLITSTSSPGYPNVLHAFQGGAGPEYRSWSMEGMNARHSGNFPATAAPKILVQPKSKTLPMGYNLTLSVSATGFPAPHFQWRYEGDDILGANYGYFSITNAKYSYAGGYSVVVSNSLGQVESEIATLTVADPAIPVAVVDIVAGSVSTISNLVSKVYFSKYDWLRVGLLSNPSDNLIYYTLDGSKPDRNSTPFSGGFRILQTSTLRAIAYPANSTVGVEADPIDFEMVPAYQLNAYVEVGGKVTILCDGTAFGPRYYSNETAIATVLPDGNWRFLKWLGDSQSTNSTISFKMDATKWALPVFGHEFYSTNIGSGSVVVPASRSVFPLGSTIRLSAVPDPGNYFVAWTNVLADNQNPLAILYTNNTANPVAVFQPLPTNKFTLVVTTSGNGDVTLDRLPNLPLLFNKGQAVTLIAKADTNQTFVGWTGDVSSTNNPLTLTMDKTKRVDAQFTDNPVIQVGRYFTGVGMTNFVFSVTSLSNSVYAVEHSTDLRTWKRIDTISITDGIAGFSEPLNTSSTSNFYRLETP